MNLNTICLRIFYVLFLLIVGGVLVAGSGKQLLMPLAVCVLPTHTTEAAVQGPGLMEFTRNSSEFVYLVNITYGGKAAELRTRTPPQSAALQVRYVTTFPSFVVRDIPGGTPWTYYADTSTWREAEPLIVWTFLWFLVAWLFWRHLRKSRRGARHR
jgi:hypothetical protein